MDKETSARVSSIASGLLDFRRDDFLAIADSRDNEKIDLHCESVRTLAGTALVQDQTAGQKPTTFHDRLKIEHANLVGKHDALTLFMSRENPDVTPTQRALLELQKDAMGLYRRVLEMRLANLGEL